MRSAAFLLAGALAFAQTRTVSDAEVQRVHKSLLLIDTHNDFVDQHNDETVATVKSLDIGGSIKGHTDLARLRAGGVGAVFFAAYVAGSMVTGNRSAHRTLENIEFIRNEIVAKHPKDFVLALTADDIVSAHKSGRIAALIGIEGGHAIQDSLRLLRIYSELGVRYMTLTHNNNNNWADAANGSGAPNNGLSPFGKQVVAEMNRLGMMVDVSHVSDKTFADVIAVSQSPVIASHSSCRAISNVKRNMSDEMIVAMAKKGGVIQINFACDFLSQAVADLLPRDNPEAARRLEEQIASETTDPARRAQLNLERRREIERNVTPPPVAAVVDHIDHVVKIAGIDAVGIGSDYDGVGCVPKGLEDVSKFPNLTRALLEKGYTAAQIKKIYGDNLLRVMRANEQVSRSLRAQ
jgi:membrane dipeptidase